MIKMYCHACMKFSKNRTTILKLTNKSKDWLRETNEIVRMSLMEVGQPQHSALRHLTFEHCLVCLSQDTFPY